MEPLSKIEFQYEKTIEKQNQLIEKLEHQNSTSKSSNDEQKKQINELKAELENALKENAELKAKNQTLTNDLTETTTECQAQVDAVELQNDELEKHNEELTLENQELKAQNEAFEADLKETTLECQKHVDNIEQQNDQLELEIEVFKSKLLTNEELMFYYVCKADMLLKKAYNNKMDFTLGELEAIGFPTSLLRGADNEGIRTTNFSLLKQTNNNYSLTKN